MRISGLPTSNIAIQSTTETLAEQQLPSKLPGAPGCTAAGVQFGQAPEVLLSEPKLDNRGTTSFLSLFQGLRNQPDKAVPEAAPQAPSAQPISPAPVTTLASAPAEKPNEAANAPKADAADFLDNSVYSSPEALKRWEPLVAGLPPEQRLQAEKELNRPIAAARMAAGKGPDAEKAMAYINANPALKTAVDVGKSGGNADGKITHKDLKAFAKNMEKAADKANWELSDYQRNNPGADPQSMEMVRTAALIQANLPLICAAGAQHAQGAQNKTKVDGKIGAADLNALVSGNPGLSGLLRQAANTWAQPGFLGQLDQAGLSGKKLSANSPDQRFDMYNLSAWIKSKAPTNATQFASMLSDAATLNAVSGIDISKLDEKVFENPKSYSGAQKAAVMVRLQQLQQSVIAGRSLHNTKKTEAALAERISQLQADSDVQAYLNKKVPEQERALVRSDAALQRAVSQQFQALNSGQSLQADMAAADAARNSKKPYADYSTAINNLQAQLQLQRDLLPDSKVPTAQEILSKHPALETAIGESYVRNFAQGGALQQLLAQKKVSGEQALAAADAQKAAYDSLLPSSFTQELHGDYLASSLAQLQGSKKGRKLLEGNEQNNLAKLTELAGQFGPKALQSIAGFASVSDMLSSGNKLGAAQVIYESTILGAEGIKAGVDAGAKLLGREASAGLGRMTGQLAGRAVAMVAGEAAGMAAGAALGAAIPIVGWAIDGAMALGFGISAIVDAVKRRKDQRAFDRNVDPILNQFGIPKAH